MITGRAQRWRKKRACGLTICTSATARMRKLNRRSGARLALVDGEWPAQQLLHQQRRERVVDPMNGPGWRLERSRSARQGHDTCQPAHPRRVLRQNAPAAGAALHSRRVAPMTKRNCQASGLKNHTSCDGIVWERPALTQRQHHRSRPRNRQRQERLPRRISYDDDQRKGGEQHDVERQDVEEHRLEAPADRARMIARCGSCRKVRDAHLFGVDRVLYHQLIADSSPRR